MTPCAAEPAPRYAATGSRPRIPRRPGSARPTRRTHVVGGGSSSRPGSRTRTSTRRSPAATACTCTCSTRTAGRTTSRGSGSTPTRTPSGEWITGGGWAMEYFPGGNPHKDDLDAIVPDRPVFMLQQGHARGVGQLAGRSRSRASTTRSRRPGRRPLRARRGGPAHRHAARGRGVLLRGPDRAAGPALGVASGDLERAAEQAEAPPAGSTPWVTPHDPRGVLPALARTAS